jgi:hypothetical protein
LASTATLVWDILKQYRLHCRQACKVTHESQQTRDRQLEWALNHEGWTEEWRWVIWSDKCPIVLGAHPSMIWVTCKVGKEWNNYTIPYNKQTNKCVMVWGCITRDSKCPLVVLEYPGGKGGGMDTTQYQE